MAYERANPICLGCGKETAIYSSPYGWGYGKTCSKKQKAYSIKTAAEITTEEIKTQRKEYENDVLQRYQGDTPNLKYIKTYGKAGFSKEELKAARNEDSGFYTNKEERYSG